MHRIIFLLLLVVSCTSQAQIKWQFNSQGMISGKPIVHQSNIYFISDESLKVLNSKGSLLWQYHLKSSSSSEVAIDEHAIYLLAENGLHAINHSGQKLWFFESKDQSLLINGESWGWGKKQVKDIWSWYRSSPIIVNNKIVFANANGTYALDKTTGKQIWHTNTGVTHTKPAFDQDTVVVGSWDNNLYGLAVDTGKVSWKFHARTPDGSMKDWQGWQGFNLSPLIHNGTVYVGSRGSYFYAIGVKNGVEYWSSQYAATWIGSSAIQHKEKIYFGTSDGYSIVGLDAKKGAQTLLFRNDFYNFAQPQAKDDTLYFGSVSGQVYAVNTNDMTGEKIFSTPKSVLNYADLVNTDGGLKALYATANDYNYINSRKDADRMLQKLNSVLSMNLVDDTLYIGTANGILFAIAI